MSIMHRLVPSLALYGLLALCVCSVLTHLAPAAGLYSGDTCMCNFVHYPPPSAGPRLDSVLYELGNIAYNATVCAFTFQQLLDSHADDCPCTYLDAVTVHTCSQHCLRSVDGRVYGSYPYHAASSVCLAAIHSGIISDEDGGALLAQRFYPLSWANDSTQTVFPHGSSSASYSNGVQSLPVPDGWHQVPAPLPAFSWTVRSRGAIERQRQQAPFSPRAGHVHVANAWPLPSGPLSAVHVIVGGHNAKSLHE